MEDYDDFELFDLIEQQQDESAVCKETFESYLGRISDTQFFEAYRMTKQCFMVIYDALDYPHKKRGNFLDPKFELLVLLRYLATGSFMLIAGDLLSISKSTAHGFIHRAMKIVCKSASKWIKFPSDIETVKQDFQAKFEFPGVIGAIDCTHVKMESIGGPLAEVYRNRKGVFSINVQAVCGPKLMFFDVVARWPGSTHDSRIFSNSRLNFDLESGKFSDGYLLGDAGYPLKIFLMTPYSNPSNHSQKRYNKRHSQTRMFIEKAFGVLKRRFPLLKHGVKMRKGEDNCMLILAAFVLHNMIIHFKYDVMFEHILEQEEYARDVYAEMINQDESSEEAIRKRDFIANSFIN